MIRSRPLTEATGANCLTRLSKILSRGKHSGRASTTPAFRGEMSSNALRWFSIAEAEDVLHQSLCLAF
mgnify:CR=1 FL=1